MSSDFTDVLVVFDWNGTVMDDARRATHSTNSVLTSRSRPPVDLDQFRADFTLPLRDWLLNLGIDASDVERAESEWNDAMLVEASPRSGALQALTVLHDRGAVLGVASAAAAGTVAGDIERAGLTELLDFVATGVTDKSTFLRGQRDRRTRAMYVGDTAYDMRSARAAGYRAVAITGGYQSEQSLAAAQPDHIITDLSELAIILSTVTV